MSVQALQEFINRYNTASMGLGALGAALDAKASGAPLEPAIAARVEELLTALGGRDLLADVSAPQAAAVLAEVRMTLGMDSKLPYAHTRTASWSFEDPLVLQAVGEFARQHADGITHKIVPALDGMAARLERGGVFLDIGVGVAGTAIAMAQQWPAIRVVGIDVWQPSIKLARENVARAGMSDRIELRQQAAEALEDEATIDLAWMPTMFMPEHILPTAIERTQRALKPGGWLIFNCTREIEGASPATAAMWRLRFTTFGGPQWTTERSERILRDKGFADVRTLPGPPSLPAGIVVARR